MGSPPSGRPLDRAEERVLRHLLSAWPDGAPYVRRLGSMRVVGSCSSGCVTVDLRDEQTADLDQPNRPLPVEGDLLSEAGEYMGGVLLFTRRDRLTCWRHTPWLTSPSWLGPQTTESSSGFERNESVCAEEPLRVSGRSAMGARLQDSLIFAGCPFRRNAQHSRPIEMSFSMGSDCRDTVIRWVRLRLPL
jgi:hypothetical protein